MKNITSKKIIILFSIFTLIIISLSIFSIFYDNSKQLQITNIDKYIKNLPDNQRKILYKKIYNILSLSKSVDKYKNDLIIRADSYTETYNKTSKIYYSSFIIDIASIKQSYKIYLQWTINSNIDSFSEFATFECLPKNELIYGDFNCSKYLNSSTLSSDEIIQYLPYYKPNYTITLKSNFNNNFELYIDIYLDLADTENNKTEASIIKYKQYALDWIKSKNLNPDNYKITYRIHGN